MALSIQRYEPLTNSQEACFLWAVYNLSHGGEAELGPFPLEIIRQEMIRLQKGEQERRSPSFSERFGTRLSDCVIHAGALDRTGFISAERLTHASSVQNVLQPSLTKVGKIALTPNGKITLLRILAANSISPLDHMPPLGLEPDAPAR